MFFFFSFFLSFFLGRSLYPPLRLPSSFRNIDATKKYWNKRNNFLEALLKLHLVGERKLVVNSAAGWKRRGEGGTTHSAVARLAGWLAGWQREKRKERCGRSLPKDTQADRVVNLLACFRSGQKTCIHKRSW